MYASDSLPSDEADALDLHLSECPSCAARFDTLHASIIAALRDTSIGDTACDEADNLAGLIDSIHELVPLETGPTSAAPADADSSVDVTEAELIALLAPAQRPDELGWLGKYRIVKVLGIGGMGAVFRAEDTGLKRTVAIKVIRPTRSADAEQRKQRFLREAHAVAALTHDNIVPIHDAREDRGIPYLVMPLLKGEPLDVRLKREPRLPLDLILQIARETAEGLKAAHTAGLIHRDLKSENLWLEDLGSRVRVRILDFGLASFEKDDDKLSHPGTLLGTPDYMAPEQARGEKADARSDLFSLGCILYRLCTGKRPFSGDGLTAILLAVQTQEPPAPIEVDASAPTWLSELVMRLLEKDPTRRLQSAAEVLDSLRDPLLASFVGWAKSSRPTKSRTVGREDLAHPTKRIVLFAALVLLMAAAVIIIKLKNGGRVEIDAPDDPNLPTIVKIYPPDAKADERVPKDSSDAKAKFSIAHAQNLFDEGHFDDGTLWLVRALEQAPQNETALRRRILTALDMCRPEAQKAIAVFPHPGGEVWSAVFDPTGKFVLSACFDGKARLWEIASKKCVKQFVHADPQEKPIRGVAFHKDGTVIATTAGEFVSLWDVAKEERLYEATRLKGFGREATFSPDGQKLLVAVAGDSSKGGPQLYDLRGGKPKSLPVQGWDHLVNAVAFNKDGSRFVAAGWNSYAVYDARTGESLSQQMGNLTFDRATFSSDGKWLLLGAADAQDAQLVNFTSEKLLKLKHKSAANLFAVAIDPDSTLALTGGGDGRVLVWDLATQERVGPAITIPGPKRISHAQFSADGQFFLIATLDGSVVEVRPTPRPLIDDPRRIALWAKAMTGKQLTGKDEIEKLAVDEIKDLLEQVKALGGAPMR